MSTHPLPFAAPETVGLSAARLANLSSVLQRKIDAGHLPGAVAAIARRGQLCFFEAFGKRDPAGAEPMGIDSLFRIYSMTKPIVTVAAMMLWEEGGLLLNDPVAKFIPDFADQQVGAIHNGEINLVPAESAATIQDLMRHTAGLTYEFHGNGPVQRAYMDAKIYRRSQNNADQSAMLGKLPLSDHPGRRWEYSRASDVLGRVVEVASGQPLGAFLQERIFAPLGMVDTGFHAPREKHGRLAQGFAKDPDTGVDVTLLDVREPALFESGGGGLVSSTMDYARFVAMLLNKGRLDGTRLLARTTVELMTADHIGPMPRMHTQLPPGYGFGLGFAVRLGAGIATMPGAPGQYYWSGAAGTSFWVDPREELFAVLMIQAPGPREYYRVLFRDLVYAAIDD